MRRMQAACVSPPWLTVLTLCLLGVAASGVRADVSRIVMLNARSELVSAARAAFERQVVPVFDAGAAAWSGDARQLERLRALAREQAAEVVVWELRGAQGSELWVYAARFERVLGVRHVAEEALPAATAAALVLSIKTLLQVELDRTEEPARAESPGAGSAADETLPVAGAGAGAGGARGQAAVREQDSAAPQDRQEPQSADEVAPGASRDAAVRSSGAVVIARDRAALTAAAERSAESRPRGLELAIMAGVARCEGQLAARYGIAAAIWRRGLGAELRGELGPAVIVGSSAAWARAFEAALAAELLARTTPLRGLHVSAGLGPRLHYTRLWGALGQADVAVDVTRLGPGIGFSLQLEYMLAPALAIGLFAQAGWLIRTQRYFVDDARAYEASRWRGGIGGRLGLVLP